MIVVSNTAPLNYLALIQQSEVLPALYGAVVIPEAVYQELTSTSAPEAVQAWMTPPPRGCR